MHTHFSLVMTDNKHKSPLNQFCNLAVLAMHSKRQVNVTLLLYHVCVMNFDIKNINKHTDHLKERKMHVACVVLLVLCYCCTGWGVVEEQYYDSQTLNHFDGGDQRQWKQVS